MAIRAVRQVRRRIDQGVGMTAGAVIGTGRGDQAAVVRGHRKVGDVPGRRVAGGAVGGTARNTGLQGRNRRMAERAVRTMRDIDRPIGALNRVIVTIDTGRGQGHVPGGHMIDTAVYGQVLIRMTVKTVSRVGTQGDRIDHFLPRAVVAGRTGTGTVGGNVVLCALDLGPGRNHVTVAAGRSRGVKREIARAFCNGMDMSRMGGVKSIGMTAQAVTANNKGLQVGVIERHAAAVGVVTAVAAVVYLRIACVDKWRRIAVAVGATRRINPDQEAVVRRIGRMGGFPGVGMTGLAVATWSKCLTDRQALQAAIARVVAARAVGQVRGHIDQGVGMTARAVIGAGRGDQGAVVRRIGDMESPPRDGMAGDAVTAAGRNTGLQGRNSRMTERAIPTMGDIHRRIGGHTRVMTVETEGRPAGHIGGRHMVDTAVRCQFLVRMAVQAVGRVGLQGDGVNDFLSRTVMTSGAGTGAVGVNIVLGTFDFSPVRHNMTVAAELARRIVGEVVGTNFYRVLKRTMVGPLVGVAVQAADLDAAQPLRNGLPHDGRIKLCAAVGMAQSAVGSLLHAMQSVDVRSAGQGAGTGAAESCCVAGMTVGTRTVDDPVVMRCRRGMQRRAVRMAVIAGIVTRIGRGHIVPHITLAIPKGTASGVVVVIMTGPAVDG